MLYPAMKAVRKTGQEKFTLAGEPRELTLLDFWRWSVSDLASNATRGRLAEFIVASALGVECDVRAEWDAYDLTTPEGIKVEVKSAAYVQSWAQNAHSPIQFSCRPTRFWDAQTSVYGSEMKRWADVYIFALLHHKERESLDAMNLDQWEFYVVPTSILNGRTRSQHSITLASLKKVATSLSYAELSAQFHLLLANNH